MKVIFLYNTKNFYKWIYMDKALLLIVAALGISTVLNLILKKLNLSLIIGYIVTGILLINLFNLQELAHSKALEHLGEFGIVFLMFTIGLEISLSKMNKMKDIIFLNGFLQVGLNALVIFLIAHFGFGIENISALIISLAFALSSTAIVLTYLKTSKEIHTPYGQRATGILIFQDLAVIPILILLGVLSDGGNQSVYEIIYQTLISVVIALFLLFVVGKQLFTWLLHFSASAENDELFMSSVLFIVIAASYFAHAMGFTYSLGAFVAGMIIAETKYFHKVEADIAPFKDILLGTFFILIGMKIDLGLFLDNIWLVIFIFFGLLVLKTVITYLGLLISSSKNIALKTSISISQVGEFALVIFALSSSTGLIESQLSKLVMLVVIFSMMVSPFIVPYTKDIAKFFIKDINDLKEVEDIGDKKEHIIICGYGRVGDYIEQHLEFYGYEYIIVDNNPKKVQNALDKGLEAYLGDMSKSAIIEALHVEDSAAVIITLDNADIKQLVVQKILEVNKNANIIIQISSKEEREKLKDLNILNAVDGEIEIARILVERVMQCQLKY